MEVVQYWNNCLISYYERTQDMSYTIDLLLENTDFKAFDLLTRIALAESGFGVLIEGSISLVPCRLSRPIKVEVR